MDPITIASLIKVASEIVGSWGDHDERKAEGVKILAEMENAADVREAELKLTMIKALAESDKNQTEINKIEAASASFFKSGWRPAAAWTCVTGLIYASIIYPSLSWVAVVYNIVPPPNIETGVLVSLLSGLLGLTVYRSYEKKEGLTK